MTEQNERLMDLVRYARHYLHDEQMIDDEEFAALVADSDNGQRVARLEDYDRMQERIAILTAERDDARRLHKQEQGCVAQLESNIVFLNQRLETAERNKSKLDDFGGNEQLAAEYSDVKGCLYSDSGYHCSCYDNDSGCCLCEGGEYDNG